MEELSKAVSIFEVQNSQKHECGECNQKIIESSKGKKNVKKQAQMET